MLTIGVTFWDNDYKNYDKLVYQLQSYVKVPYELIVIDNTEGNKLGDKATFAFGYNAHQFAARYKIIKLAKGDYIWFIDGDDEIIGFDETLFEKPFDILCTSVISNSKLITLDNVEIIEPRNHWELIQYRILQALWNKIIKTSLFDNIDDYVDNPLLEACTLEDTFYLAVALKNAKIVRLTSTFIYKKNRGISDGVLLTNEQFDNLSTGFHEIVKLFGKLGYDTNIILNSHFKYFCSFLNNSEHQGYILSRILDIYPEINRWKDKYYDIILSFHSTNDYTNFRQTYIKHFGEENIPKLKYTILYSDDTKKDVYFESIPDYSEKDTRKVVNIKHWDYTLSICGIVYNGNEQFLERFTKLVNERIKVKHEVIIVDNRNDKSEPLHYVGNVKIIPMESNVGTLNGRREGVKASKGDYIWLVDLDDKPLFVDNDYYYGDSDVLVFPVVHEEILRDNYVINLDNSISGEQLFDKSTLYKTSVCVWNKWVKRNVALKIYEDIPSFHCIFNEDNMFYCAMVKNIKQLTFIPYAPIYIHTKNDMSTTRALLKTKEQIDKLFIGFEESIAWQKEYMIGHEDIAWANPYNIAFYLQVLSNNVDLNVQDYFYSRINEVYGKDAIVSAVKEVLKDNYNEHIEWVKKINKYIEDANVIKHSFIN